MLKNFSMYGLPEKIEFCKSCVMSNQKPNPIIEFKNSKIERKGIQFDNGVCAACTYSEMKNKINWKEREKKLEEILSKYRKKDGYDCVVPSSGGKDSGFTAHILKYKHNMNPLTVTWAPHMYTNVGWNNLVNCSHIGGVDNLLFTPNGKLHRKLTQLAFLNLLHPFQPFIAGQKVIGPKIAAKFNIPLVIYGENTSEYGSSIEENFEPKMPESFFSTKKEDIVFGKLKISEIAEKYNFQIKDFEPYVPIEKNEIENKKIEVFHLGYFYKWDPQENFYYAAENTGFKANSERTEGTYSKYVGIDDKFERLHFYTTLIKFGISQASYDASQEIRNGKITRDEGIKLVQQYDSEFPKKYFNEFLDYLDIDEKKFNETIDAFRSPHLWEKKDKKWALKNKIV